MEGIGTNHIRDLVAGTPLNAGIAPRPDPMGTARRVDQVFQGAGIGGQGREGGDRPPVARSLLGAFDRAAGGLPVGTPNVVFQPLFMA
jgi:hypothetical protein